MIVDSDGNQPLDIIEISQAAITNELNKNGHADIAVGNLNRQNIGIFLGHGDGVFERQSRCFTTDIYQPFSLAVGNFNGVIRLDITLSQVGIDDLNNHDHMDSVVGLINHNE